MSPPVQYSDCSSICYSCTVTLNCDLLTPNCDAFMVHLCPIVHRWCRLGENVSNTLQDIMLTMFRDAHTDARTDACANGRTVLWLSVDRRWRFRDPTCVVLTQCQRVTDGQTDRGQLDSIANTGLCISRYADAHVKTACVLLFIILIFNDMLLFIQ